MTGSNNTVKRLFWSSSNSPPASPPPNHKAAAMHLRKTKGDAAAHSPLRTRAASHEGLHRPRTGSTAATTAAADPSHTTTTATDTGLPPLFPLDTAAAAATHSSPRRRLNSRDIPRTYSGLYGNTDDLLPFELNRRGTLTPSSVWIILGIYLTFLVVVYGSSTMILALVGGYETKIHVYSWTLTNAIHCAVTTLYIHWLKGSLYDDSGEMNALTVWEQLEATQNTRALREALMVVPCFLTWLACHVASYDKEICLVNTLLWAITMLGKLPCMNGVRIFGINRTAGIDDDDLIVEDDGGQAGGGGGGTQEGKKDL